MTIYLDYIFIENFLMDYILLKETSYISRKEISKKRLIIATSVASIYVVIMVCLKIQELSYVICKIFLAIIIIYLAFNPKSISEYVKLTIIFFLISAINVGTLTVITNLLNLKRVTGLLKIIIYVVSLMLSKFFMKHMWKMYKQNIKNDDLIYEVKICLDNKLYKYNAFLDTGNNVYSYTYDVPVIFAELLDENMQESLKNKDFFYITTVTLSSTSEKKAYIFDKVEITSKIKKWHVKAAIVFEKEKISKDNSYNMLLNYNLYVENLGGIKI